MESFNCEGGKAMLCTIPTPASLPAFQPLGKMPNKAGLASKHDYYTWTKWVNCQTASFNGFETVFSIAISEQPENFDNSNSETGVKGFRFQNEKKCIKEKKVSQDKFPCRGRTQIPIDS